MPPSGPPQYGGSPYGGPPVGAGQSTNGKAIASLILGICSIVLSCGLFTGIPAIILARSAKREIAAGNGSGDGIAQGGMITGWIGTALSLLGILIVVIVIIVGAASS
jgi:hypothetical protein